MAAVTRYVAQWPVLPGFCPCGCGQMPNSGHTFIAGHQRRTMKVSTCPECGRRFSSRAGRDVVHCSKPCLSAFRRREAIDHFWSQVEPDEDGCWIYTGRKNINGYGEVGMRGSQKTTHRLIWEFAFGAPPDHLMVLHRCDIRSCVNPSHLFLGTALDNMRDCMAKGRRPVIRPRSRMADGPIEVVRR